MQRCSFPPYFFLCISHMPAASGGWLSWIMGLLAFAIRRLASKKKVAGPVIPFHSYLFRSLIILSYELDLSSDNLQHGWASTVTTHKHSQKKNKEWEKRKEKKRKERIYLLNEYHVVAPFCILLPAYYHQSTPFAVRFQYVLRIILFLVSERSGRRKPAAERSALCI